MMLRKLFSIFKIRRDERWLALATALFIVAVNALVIAKYYSLFSVYVDNDWGPFPNHFHVSGFDALVYSIISRWNSFFTIAFRHPLLPFLLYPLSLINEGLFQLTGLNCVQFVFGVLLTFCGVYAQLFLYRVFRFVVRVKRADAMLLAALMLSFAYVMLSLAVPDHFALSLYLLTFTLLVAGRYIVTGRRMDRCQTVVLFFLTAGLTVTNGAKTFLAQLFCNGKRFFHPLNLLMVVVLPTLMLWKMCTLEYNYVARPAEKARAEVRARQQKAHARAQNAPKPKPKAVKADAKAGKPLSGGRFMKWSDATTPRWKSITSNLFGESLQFHQQHRLEDVQMKRPVFVAYDHWWNYLVEGLLVLLFLLGVIAGFRSRFLWLALAWFACDLLIHLGLGFGLNEVYIMTCHWAFVIPLAIAFLLKALRGMPLLAARGLIALLAAYLYIYNVWQLVDYLAPFS